MRSRPRASAARGRSPPAACVLSQPIKAARNYSTSTNMAALALLSVSLGFAIPSVPRPTIAPRAPHPIAKVAVEQFVTNLEFLGPVRANQNLWSAFFLGCILPRSLPVPSRACLGRVQDIEA